MRNKDELVSEGLQWTPAHGRARAGRAARTYLHQLRVDTEYSLEDLPRVIDYEYAMVR